MRHEKGTFRLTKPDVRALLAFASTDASRPLCAVHFDPPRGSVVATDGHSLVKATNCGRHEEPVFTVPRAALEQASALMRRKDDALEVRRSGDTVTLVAVRNGAQLGTVTATPQRQCFPDYTAVVPDRDGNGEAAGRLGFNAALLARVQLVAAACSQESTEWRFPHHPLDPAVTLVSDPVDSTAWTAVIMPWNLGRH